MQRNVTATEEKCVAKKIALMGGITSIPSVISVARVFGAVLEIRKSANPLGIVIMVRPVLVMEAANAKTIGLEINAMCGGQSQIAVKI